MFYITVRDSENNYYIEDILEDWHDAVDQFEPIDCINSEMIIYDEQGHKYLVGPSKKLKENKMFQKISIIDVGSWDYKKGEPFLIDTYEVVPDELQKLLKTYNKHR